MNKLTTTLAGLALVAGTSIAPAFAQGTFSTDFVNPPAGVFTTTATGYFFEAPSFFNGTLAGDLKLTGTLTNGTLEGLNRYATVLNFTSTEPGLKDVTESGVTTVTAVDFGTTPSYSNFHITDTTAFGGVTGDRVSVGPLGSPVPEASTVLSFGALLALGGVAVLRRKSAVKNAA